MPSAWFCCATSTRKATFSLIAASAVMRLMVRSSEASRIGSDRFGSDQIGGATLNDHGWLNCESRRLCWMARAIDDCSRSEWRQGDDLQLGWRQRCAFG